VYADVNGRLIDVLPALYVRTGDAADLADAERAKDAVLAELRTADGAVRHGARDDGSTLHLADQTAVGAASLACARFVRAALVDPAAGSFSCAHAGSCVARPAEATKRRAP
jgi:hypothetical protein